MTCMLYAFFNLFYNYSQYNLLLPVFAKLVNKWISIFVTECPQRNIKILVINNDR